MCVWWRVDRRSRFGCKNEIEKRVVGIARSNNQFMKKIRSHSVTPSSHALAQAATQSAIDSHHHDAGATHTVHALSKHRLEALTDGIFAVAMTLLVLEIKLPEIKALVGASATMSLAQFNQLVIHQLLELQPKLLAWLISFLILAVFWLSHQSMFRHVRSVNRALLWINIVQLLFISLLPFSSSLVGQYTLASVSTFVYAGNLAMLSIMSLLQLRYLSKHAELCHAPMPHAFVRAAHVRSWSLLATAAVACVIASWQPAFGTVAFMLMFVATFAARRLERTA
jgi:uncharacterized membrane protein